MTIQHKMPTSARRATRRASVLGLASVLLAVVIAGCGGSGYGSGSGSRGAPAAQGAGAASKTSTSGGAVKSSAPRVEEQVPPGTGTAGIPQHNGGDQDADNNGGPSDGDGNI
jgi:hypothetical protein